MTRKRVPNRLTRAWVWLANGEPKALVLVLLLIASMIFFWVVDL